MLELAPGAEAWSSLRSEPAGLFRITVPVSWGAEVLAKLIPDFLHAYPKVEIELMLSDSIMDLAYDLSNR